MTIPTILNEIEDATTLRRANTPDRVLVLEDAEALTGTGGDRHKDYGDPVENHQHIADIFNAITRHSLSAREIALLLQSVKLARRAKSPRHRDSYVDGAAYIGIEYECALAEKPKWP